MSQSVVRYEFCLSLPLISEKLFHVEVCIEKLKFPKNFTQNRLSVIFVNNYCALSISKSCKVQFFTTWYFRISANILLSLLYVQKWVLISSVKIDRLWKKILYDDLSSKNGTTRRLNSKTVLNWKNSKVKRGFCLSTIW